LSDVVDEHANIQAFDGLADLGLGGLVEVAEVDACIVLVRGWVVMGEMMSAEG